MKITHRANRRLRSSLRRLVRGIDARQLFDQSLELGIVQIGVGTYGEPRILAFEPADARRPHVVIGRYCSIAPEVSIVVNGDHRTDWVTTYPIRSRARLPGANADGHPRATGPVSIGHDVWIGFGSTIMGGVSIGHGAVVAAASLVTTDVRPYAIVGGVPAKELRRRFSDEVIDGLLSLRWWDLDPDQVAELADVLCAVPDTERLHTAINTIRDRDGAGDVESDKLR